MNITPNHISFALACHYAADPVEAIGEDLWNAPHGLIVRHWLKENELIHPDTNHGTEKLAVWVKHLCSQPLPVTTWTMPKE